MNAQLKGIVSEILTYVLAAQVKYCQLNMRHPFMEQTYLDIGMFNKSMKRYGEGLMMWKRLEALQQDIYGEDSHNLVFTTRNIGACYLGLGQTENALKNFERSLEILSGSEIDHENEALQTKDREQKAALYQHIYQCYIQDHNYQKALEINERSLELVKEVHGEKTQRLASKYYQKANALLALQRKEEAIEAV